MPSSLVTTSSWPRRVASAFISLLLASSAAAQDDQDTRGFHSRLSAQTSEVEACKDDVALDDRQKLLRASEHFNRARELYEQGSYRAAIAEFATAYCHQSHPATLKNIAQAYERLVDYERAVLYFKRYILELPKDEVAERERTGFRVRTLERLPARVRVATLPANATVVLSDESGPVAKIKANRDAPLLVQKGKYTIQVEATGYQPIADVIETEIGQPYSYYFRLEPKKGTVRLTTNPPDARIFLDKKLVGLGSYIASVPIGTYEVTVEKAGRPAVTKSINVTPDQATDLDIALARKPRSGRTELLIATTGFGGLMAGTAFASVFDSDSASVLAGLGGLGIGFAGGFFGIPDDISVGKSSLIIGSTFWTAAEGVLLTSLLSCDRTEQEDGTTSESCASAGTYYGIAGLAGAAGLLASSLGSSRLSLSAGDVAVLNSGAAWGLVTGALLWSTFDEDKRARDPLLLAGLNLGLVAAGVITTQVEVSRGRSALIDLGGLGGLLVGVAAAELSAEASTGVDRADHFSLVGMATGLILSTFLTRNFDKVETKAWSKIRPVAGLLSDQGGQATVTMGGAVEF